MTLQGQRGNPDEPAADRDARRAINGILWRFRTGAPWRDVPEACGPRTTLYNRFVRWREAGVWDRLLEAVTGLRGEIVMIHSSSVRVHQHGAAREKPAGMAAWGALEAG